MLTRAVAAAVLAVLVACAPTLPVTPASAGAPPGRAPQPPVTAEHGP